MIPPSQVGVLMRQHIGALRGREADRQIDFRREESQNERGRDAVGFINIILIRVAVRREWRSLSTLSMAAKMSMQMPSTQTQLSTYSQNCEGFMLTAADARLDCTTEETI